MIYIHIPYCKQKCSYCNFHFSTSMKGKEEMLEAMKKELLLRKDELEHKKLRSLYFGGGTPSILSVDEIKMLLDEVLKYYRFENDIEITLEANPDDLDAGFLKALSQTSVNRLSIGTQSFFEEDLKLMNRAHNASEAESSIKRAQDMGFENLSIDLIYGAPTADFEIWQYNLRKTVELQVPHVSSYALTVEPQTALSSWVEKNKVSAPEESAQNRDFYYMKDFLKEQGFQHYEISNFAKKGFESRHNSAYWQYQEYLGIGPSAHSYNGHEKRSWNKANNIIYCKDLAENQLALETEKLSEAERHNEMLMIGLRTMWGVNLANMRASFSEEILQKSQLNINRKIEEGFLLTDGDYLKIPEQHWFLADGIASDLFLLNT